MDLKCNLNLKRNSLKKFRLEEETVAPATAKPGRILFSGGSMSVCKERSSGVAKWLPLTNQAEAVQKVVAAAATSWTFVHGYKNTVSVLEVLNDLGEEITPTSIDRTVEGQITVHFATAKKGTLVLGRLVEGQGSVGGGDETDPPPVINIPTFTIVANPTPKTVDRLASKSFTVTYTNRYSFPEDVDFSILGLPADTTAVLSAVESKASKNVNVTVTAGLDATLGPAVLTFRGISRTTNLTFEATLNLIVAEPLLYSFDIDPTSIPLVFPPAVAPYDDDSGIVKVNSTIYPGDPYPMIGFDKPLGFGLRANNTRIGAAQDGQWELTDISAGITATFLNSRDVDGNLIPMSTAGILGDVVNIPGPSTLNSGYETGVSLVLHTDAAIAPGEYTFNIRFTTSVLDYRGVMHPFVINKLGTITITARPDWTVVGLDGWKPVNRVKQTLLTTKLHGELIVDQMVPVAPNKFALVVKGGVQLLDFDPVMETFSETVFCPMQYNNPGDLDYVSPAIQTLDGDKFLLSINNNTFWVVSIVNGVMANLTAKYSIPYSNASVPAAVIISATKFCQLGLDGVLHTFEFTGGAIVERASVVLSGLSSFPEICGRPLVSQNAKPLALTKHVSGFMYAFQLVKGKPITPTIPGDTSEALVAIVMTKVDTSGASPVSIGNTLLTSVMSYADNVEPLYAITLRGDNERLRRALISPDGNKIIFEIHDYYLSASGLVPPGSSVIVIDVSGETPFTNAFYGIEGVNPSLLYSSEGQMDMCWLNNTHFIVQGSYAGRFRIVNATIVAAMLVSELREQGYAARNLLEQHGPALSMTNIYNATRFLQYWCQSAYFRMDNERLVRIVTQGSERALLEVQKMT